MKYFFLILVILCSCKKKSHEPNTKTFSIQAYSKSGNASIKLIESTENTGKSYSKTLEVPSNKLEFSIVLKNTSIVADDSISLTINGKQKGVKINGLYQTISIQLNTL